jgi:hypothetical protein
LQALAGDADHAVAGGGVCCIRCPGQAAGDECFHVGRVDVAAHGSGSLRTGEELTQCAQHIESGAPGGRVQIEAGAGEGLGHAKVGGALGDHQGEELKERLAWICGRRQPRGLASEKFGAIEQDRLEQRLLGGEVPAHGARAHPRPPGDLGHRHRQPLGGEGPECHLEYPGPVTPRVGSLWLHGLSEGDLIQV